MSRTRPAAPPVADPASRVTISERTALVEEDPLASMAQRIRAFLNGPTGRRLLAEGQKQLAKPENQAKLKRLLTRFTGRRR